MKFKLLENVLTSVTHRSNTYFIYMNPTSQELRSKEDSKDNRAVIDTEGNLYMEAMWEGNSKDRANLYSNMVHDDLIWFLQKEGKCPGFENDDWWDETGSLETGGVCVQRKDDGFTFYLGESYGDWIMEEEHWKKIHALFDLCKKKNPHLSFSDKGVYTI